LPTRNQQPRTRARVYAARIAPASDTSTAKRNGARITENPGNSYNSAYGNMIETLNGVK